MKTILLALLVAALVPARLALAEPALAPARKPVEMAQRAVLLVDEVRAIRNFPVLVAESLGYLREGPLVVTVVNTRNEVWHGDQLRDGRIDAVLAYYHHNIANQAQGFSTQAVVTLGLTPGMQVLVSEQARARLHTAADLKGARIIAGGDGSSKTSVANSLVAAGGLQLSDYVRLGTGGRERNAALLAGGGADLIVAPVPDGDYYVQRGVASMFADLTTLQGTRAALGNAFPTSTVYMATERIEAHPEIARLLARAFVRTLAYINHHTPEQIAALIPADVKGKDEAAYLRMLRLQIGMFASDGRMPPEAARQEWSVLAAFVPAYRKVAVEETYTNRFVEEAGVAP
jgi:NitT/TauT family transport system substrate-binding protein